MRKHVWFFSVLMFFCTVSFAQQGSTEQLAVEFLRSGQTEKALQLFEEAYSRNPTQHIFRLYLDALLQQRNIRQAERLVRRHQQNFPQNLITTIDLGHVYLVSGDLSRAEREFRRVIDNLPNSQSQIAEIAVAFFNRNQVEHAIQTFLKGRQLLRNPHAFSQDLAILYERTNRIADMTKEYLTMLEHNPRSLPLVQQRIQVVLASDTEDKRATNEIR